jgi:hypothetical protein
MTYSHYRSIITLGLLFFLIIISCSDKQTPEDIKPNYKTGTFVRAKSPGQVIFGDSAEITFYYALPDSNYRFHDLKMEKLGSTDLYVEQLSFELELIKDYVTAPTETDSVTWKYLPEKTGNYGIIMDNPGEDDLRSFVRVSYKSFEMTMDSTDYQIIMDSVRSNPNLEQYISQWGDAEYYFGSAVYYQNFDLRISKRIETGQTEFENMTEEEAKEVMLDRIKTVLKLVLRKNYPEAELNTFYYIYFETYNNNFSRSNYEAKYQCRDEGAQYRFEFIELKEIY